MIVKTFNIIETSFRYGTEQRTIHRRFFNEEDRDVIFDKMVKEYREYEGWKEEYDKYYKKYIFEDSDFEWAYSLKKEEDSIYIAEKLNKDLKPIY